MRVSEIIQRSAQQLFEQSGRAPASVHLGPVAGAQFLRELAEYIDREDLAPGAAATFGELDVYVHADAAPLMAELSYSRISPGRSLSW